MAYETAQLVAWSFHNPKKFPEFRPTQKAGASKEASQEVADAMVRAYFIGHSMRGKDGSL